ncbi:hypothetical protein ACC734_38150, partial [Rhizobium ruizarguesonis]
DAMTRGQEKINENAKDVQGGVPSTPFEAEDYEDALLPLINYNAYEKAKAGQSDRNCSGLRQTLRPTCGLSGEVAEHAPYR